jgi:nucleoside-diphosphate-sugar epimerase
MMRIVETGGRGKAGRAVVRELIERAHTIISVDLAPLSKPLRHLPKADLSDLGQALVAQANLNLWHSYRGRLRRAQG